jgi:hypothetical protein
MINVSSETLDRYLGYHYYVNAITSKSKHKLPYVAVDLLSGDQRCAWIDIREKTVHFYSNSTVSDITTLNTWMDKNHPKAVKVWNRLNPSYPV